MKIFERAAEHENVVDLIQSELGLTQLGVEVEDEKLDPQEDIDSGGNTFLHDQDREAVAANGGQTLNDIGLAVDPDTGDEDDDIPSPDEDDDDPESEEEEEEEEDDDEEQDSQQRATD